MLPERLLEVLAAARKAPFYEPRLPRPRRLDDDSWQAVPLTRKCDLRAAYPFGMLAVERTRLATYHESSGTSGEPTASYFTDADWDDVTSRFLRNAVGLGPDDTVLVKTPYSMVTTAHQMHRAARSRGALVVPADNRSSNMSYARVVRLLKDLPITVSWCLPTEVMLWEAAARLAGLDPRRDFPALRAFLVAGESLSPARQRRLSDLWGNKRVLQDYGSTETGSLGGECTAGKLHLWSDRVYAEVLDAKTGRTTPFGTGQLVVTTLQREAMPLVRYLLEDQVRIAAEPCACGSPHPTIAVFGRAGDLASVQGIAFYPIQLEDCVFSLPMEHGVTFWRARHGGEALAIEIDAAPGHAGAAAEELTRLILLRLGVKASVRTVAGLVPHAALAKVSSFGKPRYVFRSHEDWRDGLGY